MRAGDQDETIGFLSRPQAYPAGAGEVRRVETHISVVFLAGDRAYKLKRAVKLPCLDFTLPELRRAACLAEVEVNRRTAPGIYLGVVALTRGEEGGLKLGGGGEAVDWLVEMARFDEDTLFDRLAVKGALGRDHMEDLAEVIAGFHQRAERRRDRGGRSAVAAVIENSAQCFAECAGGILDRERVGELTAASRRAVQSRAALLDGRAGGGQARLCHGDLHLRNIFLLDGKPTLFDGIEFDRDFATIDVLYDLSFLLMDLDHRDLRRLANIAFNRYMDVTGDVGGLGALPLFLSMRAAIRSHVAAAAVPGAPDAESQRSAAAAYLGQAHRYLAPVEPRLVAVGGLSGSGKSRLARELAPFIGAAPGALVARSDAVRKRLAGVPLLSRLGAEGYSEEMSKRTYATVFEDAAAALEAGHSAIADCVFADPEQRAEIAAVAAAAGVPFQGIWVAAPLEVRERRVSSRKRNVSDATAEIARRQLDYDIGEMEWPRVDSSGPRDDTLAAGLRLLGL